MYFICNKIDFQVHHLSTWFQTTNHHHRHSDTIFLPMKNTFQWFRFPSLLHFVFITIFLVWFLLCNFMCKLWAVSICVYCIFFVWTQYTIVVAIVDVCATFLYFPFWYVKMVSIYVVIDLCIQSKTAATTTTNSIYPMYIHNNKREFFLLIPSMVGALEYVLYIKKISSRANFYTK